MRIISLRTLREFWEKKEYRDSEQQLKSWYEEAKKSHWNNFNEIKNVFRNASIVGNDRVVFNIKGNDYRLVVSIEFEYHTIYIRFVGTHKQYDKINVKTI